MTNLQTPILTAANGRDGGTRKAYMVGGGIASLASAAYLIRDGGFAPNNISILEQDEVLGGSLDGQGSPDGRYVIRGGRMFTEDAYTCTWDLLRSIPSLTDPHKSVMDEVVEFNARVKSHSKSRLVARGCKVDVSTMGLSNKDRLDLVEMLAVQEKSLGAKRIEDVFQPSFFKTNFWYMWATTFAFQPWHSAVEMKRYMHRFIQEFPRFHTLGGVRRTPYNQYDSIVLPVITWLRKQGIQFVTGTHVTDLDFTYGADGKGVERIHYVRDGEQGDIAVQPQDLVFVTNGSMTDASSLGTMTSPAPLNGSASGGSWALWEKLAQKHADFGKPAVFNANVAESKWLSFTTTLRDATFFDLMETFTGNKPGTGGLVTFIDSNWLMSVVLPYQPHFLSQPAGVYLFWGYGLFPDEPGNFVPKKMSECTGEEILMELLRHLRFDEHISAVLASAECVPCMMPFITSQFMPRVLGDRPQVRPTGTTNIAFVGQFCEIPDDVVFTVDYSVRSAQTAVYQLLGIEKPVTPIYKGQHDAGVVLRAMAALLR